MIHILSTCCRLFHRLQSIEVSKRSPSDCMRAAAADTSILMMMTTTMQSTTVSQNGSLWDTNIQHFLSAVVGLRLMPDPWHIRNSALSAHDCQHTSALCDLHLTVHHKAFSTHREHCKCQQMQEDSDIPQQRKLLLVYMLVCGKGRSQCL